MRGGGGISLKINSDSPSRTPGAGLAPLRDALEPGDSVRPRPGASLSPEEVGGSPAAARLKRSVSPRDGAMTRGGRFPLAARGPGLLPLPGAFRRPAAQLRFPSAPRESGGGTGSPSTCTSRRKVLSGWSGAGRLRPKPSRPRLLPCGLLRGPHSPRQPGLGSRSPAAAKST